MARRRPDIGCLCGVSLRLEDVVRDFETGSRGVDLGGSKSAACQGLPLHRAAADIKTATNLASRLS